MEYRALPLPGTGLELMNFGEEKNDRLRRAVDEGLKSGAFDHSRDILLREDTTIDNGFDDVAYWFAKTVRPIERPKIGSDLEDRLKPFMKPSFAFPTEDIDVRRTVRFSALGDLMSARGLENSKDKVYEDVADIVFNADIIHSNLESTMTKKTVDKVSFADMSPKINMTAEQYKGVIGHRGRKYDVLTIANNHILDCGEEGIETTTEMLDNDGVRYLGVNKTREDAERPVITNTAGLKIGWVAHTFSVNNRPIPEDKPFIVNITPFLAVEDPDISNIIRQIKALKAQNCDLIIASMHWGMEFELYPREEQLKWAREMANAGADAIIGHHPHVPQHYEVIHPEGDPGKCVPVIFSLGNALPVLSGPATVLSLALQLSIAEGTRDGERAVRISGMQVTPVAAVCDDAAGIRLLRLTTLMKAEKSPEFAEYVESIIHYADSVMGTGWRRYKGENS